MKLKLRCWHKIKEKMFIVSEIDFLAKTVRVYKASGEEQKTEFVFDDIEIMVFAGLLDKRGKEICEGDIDKSGLIVRWNQLHCCFGLFNKSGYVKDITSDVYDKKGDLLKEWTTSSIEVIGNIYEGK